MSTAGTGSVLSASVNECDRRMDCQTQVQLWSEPIRRNPVSAGPTDLDSRVLSSLSGFLSADGSDERREHPGIDSRGLTVAGDETLRQLQSR